ncbi:MAG TPA: ROK family protein [Phycisphaerae bacterium]|nr:ROK family protein [Phycisphaerae bacterium]
MAKLCIGIDLGGTFIKFGLLDGQRNPGRTFPLPTPVDRGAEGVVEQMVQGAEKLIRDEGIPRDQVMGVGIGSPGPINLSDGIIISMPNIPGMDDCPLRDRVSAGLNLPAVLENDANAAAYGEYVCGAGGNSGDMVLLTLGTGIGSGIILDGKILHGSHEIGGELGHMIVAPGGELCGCGQRGCLERHSSATYMAQYAARLIREEGRPSSLREVLDRKGGIDAADVNAARRAGDALAVEVWDRAVHYLAVACVNICRIFDPERIVLAGGLTKAGDDLMDPLREHFRQMHWTLSAPKTELLLSSLGNDAGVIGAAGVAWSAFGGR